MALNIERGCGRFIMRPSYLLMVIPLTAFLLITSSHHEAQTSKALLLFGGRDHKTFLGCLNCVNTSEASVCNDVGKYGSDVAADSIWNEVALMGPMFLRPAHGMMSRKMRPSSLITVASRMDTLAQIVFIMTAQESIG